MTRILLFAAGVAGAFLAAFGLGSTLDVSARTVAGPEHGGEAAAATAVPAGLAVEQDGYRLAPERAIFSAGRAAPYAFRIIGPDGSTLRDFDVEHERRLHLIVVDRARPETFLHLHPRLRADGSWTVPLKLPRAGSYRVFADFTTGGERRTLGIDLTADGGADITAERLSRYDVALSRVGERVEFRVTDDGRPVAVEPYLGARGHLVVLREGDLAYVHAHADEDELAFDVPFPSEGTYRLYLQFQVDGAVETARFEVTA